MATISVIIPVYNVEKYLHQCLDSVVNQTLKDVEIICINDGSSDNSLKILREYETAHSSITVIDQKNTGVGRARNNGLKAAHGEFVAFMDPDDYYPEKDILETMYNNAKEYNVPICGGSFSEDHDGKMVTKFRKAYEKYTFQNSEIMAFKDYQFDYGYMRFVYNLNMLKENNIYFPEYIRFQDPPFFVKAMITAKKFYAMQKITYCYRWGHQKLNWNHKRANDLVKGLTDDLILSRDAGLSELHYLTIQRFNYFYINQITDNISDKNMELINLLIKANGQIDPDLLKEANPKINARSFILEPLKTIVLAGIGEKTSAQKLERVLNSRSYKIGKTITYLPGRIIKRSRGKQKK